MALSVSTAFATLFDAEVKQKYQAQRKLSGLVRERDAQGSNTVKFPKLGKGTASIRTPQSDVVPINATYTQATATMVDYGAFEYSDIFNQSHVNFNDRSELVELVGNAIGRRMDQVVIDALDAATPATVANGIGGSTTDLNVAKIREAAKKLNANNVPASDRVLLIHANSLNSLLGETQATSIDFSTSRALMDGSVNQFMGFTIVTLGDMDEGGLTIDGSSDRLAYAFHKNAIGLGVSMNQQSRVDYVPEKTSFLVSSMFSAGAVAVEDTTAGGIVQITCREA
jgi:N4-gp56 family major capsid protein